MKPAAKPPATNAAADSDSDDDVEQLQYKICILGDGAVGKTSITSRFTTDTFASSYKQTIGVDFFIQRLVLPNGIHVALQIWDIGGQTIGSKMIGNYIYGSQAVLLCYDLTNYQTFQSLEDWLGLLQRTYKGKEETLPYIAVVSNKFDLNHLRAVKQDKHQAFVDDIHASMQKSRAENANPNTPASSHSTICSFAVSAKTGENINSMFHQIAADLAGVVLTKAELEAVGTKVQKAEIINYPQHDPTVQEKLVIKERKKDCSIQ